MANPTSFYQRSLAVDMSLIRVMSVLYIVCVGLLTSLMQSKLLLSCTYVFKFKFSYRRILNQIKDVFMLRFRQVIIVYTLSAINVIK